jgi:hypothetical protein
MMLIICIFLGRSGTMLIFVIVQRKFFDGMSWLIFCGGDVLANSAKYIFHMA